VVLSDGKDFEKHPVLGFHKLACEQHFFQYLGCSSYLRATAQSRMAQQLTPTLAERRTTWHSQLAALHFQMAA
jgi:hypothetical protein